MVGVRGGNTVRLAERLLVHRFGNEAVVLNLTTGAFFRVGGAGVAIAEALARGDAPEAVARRLAHEAGIELGSAQASIEAVAVALAADGPPAPRNETALAPSWHGLELRWGGRAVLRLDDAGRRASVLGDAAVPPSPGVRLRWAVPHLVWLSGGAVLHAAAVRLGGAVLAITGASGSGKSTLARYLACGAELVSDDLLLLREGRAGLEAVLGGEGAARAWAAREVLRLASGQEAHFEVEDLAALTAGPTLPLAGIWLLDAAQRDGDEITLSVADGAERLALLLHQSFGETGAPAVWRRVFDVSARLVEGVPVSRASVPGTLSLLDEAARRYRASVAS
jgi:hypothetical protein